MHKHTHTFVAVDEVGRKLGEKVVKATTDGHHDAVLWARTQFWAELRWGIEDCRHLSARLERDLLTAGQHVVRVPPKMMAQTRNSARTRGKSDPIDADAASSRAVRPPVGCLQSGAISASGPMTKRRSAARGCGRINPSRSPLDRP